MHITAQTIHRNRHTRTHTRKRPSGPNNKSFYENLTGKSLGTHCVDVAVNYGSPGEYPQEEHEEFDKLVGNTFSLENLVKKVISCVESIGLPSVWRYLTKYPRNVIGMSHLEALEHVLKNLNAKVSRVIIFGLLVHSQNLSVDVTRTIVPLPYQVVLHQIKTNIIAFEQKIISDPYVYGPKEFKPYEMMPYVFSQLDPKVRAEIHLSPYADSRYETTDHEKNMSERLDYMISAKYGKFTPEAFKTWVSSMASELVMMLSLYQNSTVGVSMLHTHLQMKAKLKQIEIQKKKNAKLKGSKKSSPNVHRNDSTSPLNSSVLIESLLFKKNGQFTKPIMISKKFKDKSLKNLQTAKENIKMNMKLSPKNPSQELLSMFVRDKWVKIKLTSKPIHGGPPGSMFAYLDTIPLAWTN